MLLAAADAGVIKKYGSMASFLKKIIKQLIKVIAAIIIVFGGLIGFSDYLETSAKSKATQFCDSIAVGDKTDGILERAAGSDQRHTNWFVRKEEHIDWLAVTFIGVPPFSRHYCSIEARNGIVISKKVRFMD
ncbi:hypothetical protein PN36_20460 [Candidatus Thiomargarita nelsonii]|uniref:Uncharacterized protein n=1 Tax=Candidatus Thiomargarita nelsonii TaxID=1003181 RepID=A0A0A6PBN7_9GAMM|nr:hypothetical protein PN36_20460 [Candidatus Thiomargarita nelsonii]